MAQEQADLSVFRFVRRGTPYRLPYLAFPVWFACIIGAVVLFIPFEIYLARAGYSKLAVSLLVVTVFLPFLIWFIKNHRLQISLSDGNCEFLPLSGPKKGQRFLAPVGDYASVVVRFIVITWSYNGSMSQRYYYDCVLKHETQSSHDIVFQRFYVKQEAVDLAEIISHFLKKPIYFAESGALTLLAEKPFQKMALPATPENFRFSYRTLLVSYALLVVGLYLLATILNAIQRHWK